MRDTTLLRTWTEIMHDKLPHHLIQVQNSCKEYRIVESGNNIEVRIIIINIVVHVCMMKL